MATKVIFGHDGQETSVAVVTLDGSPPTINKQYDIAPYVDYYPGPLMHSSNATVKKHKTRDVYGLLVMCSGYVNYIECNKSDNTHLDVAILAPYTEFDSTQNEP